MAEGRLACLASAPLLLRAPEVICILGIASHRLCALPRGTCPFQAHAHTLSWHAGCTGAVPCLCHAHAVLACYGCLREQVEVCIWPELGCPAGPH
jgi:hypothetical protein